MNLFSRIFRSEGILWCFALQITFLCSACTGDSNELPELPQDRVLLLGDRLTSLEDASELSIRTRDEIILARYLDDLGLPYVFDVQGLGATNRSHYADREVIFSTEFTSAFPPAWPRSHALRYTRDVLVGPSDSSAAISDSYIYHFPGSDLDWVRDTEFAPARREILEFESSKWSDVCSSEPSKSYFILPQGYSEEALTRCPAWTLLAASPVSRPISLVGTPSTAELIQELNLVLTELQMTGHRFEVHHDSWSSIRKRRVLRIAAERSPFTYFLERGTEKGLAFELLAWFAKENKLRTEIYPVTDRAQGIAHLQDGRADILVTLDSGETLANWIPTSRSYFQSTLSVIHDMRSPGDATGQFGIDATLESAPFIKTFITGSADEPTPKIVRWDQALESLKVGELKRFITSEPMSRWLSQHVDAVHTEEFSASGLAPKSQWVFGVRSSASGLQEVLDAFIESKQGSLIWNVIRNRYVRSKRAVSNASPSELQKRRKIPFESQFRKLAGEFGLDWRLVAAQASVESGFNPEAVSWVGARGILQVMPATAEELGIQQLHRVENGLSAGMRYLNWLMKRFEPTLPYRQRLRFALAAYNIGLGHVRDARKLAIQLNLDPNRWFGNVEQAILKLREPRYYQKARYGYCRGGEVVAYVSKIQTLYDVYVQSFTP